MTPSATTYGAVEIFGFLLAAGAIVVAGLPDDCDVDSASSTAAQGFAEW